LYIKFRRFLGGERTVVRQPPVLYRKLGGLFYSLFIHKKHTQAALAYKKMVAAYSAFFQQVLFTGHLYRFKIRQDISGSLFRKLYIPGNMDDQGRRHLYYGLSAYVKTCKIQTIEAPAVRLHEVHRNLLPISIFTP